VLLTRIAAFDQFVDPKRLVNEDVQSNRANSQLKEASLVEALDMIEQCGTIEEVHSLI
jgi:hypothetical protein